MGLLVFSKKLGICGLNCQRIFLSWTFLVSLVVCHDALEELIHTSDDHPDLMAITNLKSCLENQKFSFKEIDDFLKGYNICTMLIRQHKHNPEILEGIDYMYKIKNSDVSLSCASCLPYSANLTWTKLYPENYNETLVKWRNSIESDQGRKLELYQIDKESTGYYICNWTYTSSTGETIRAIGNIISLEVFAGDDFKLVRKRNYSIQQGLVIDNHGENLYIFTEFSPWSYCSRCNVVGKRHSFGICYVSIWDSERSIPHSPWTVAISLFKDKRMSCTMFLNLFPEILSDSETESTNGTLDFLSRQTPIIMVSYCKIPCNRTNINHTEEFQKLPQEIRDLYLISTKNSVDTDKNLVTSFIIQISHTTVFEITVIILFVLLISFILFNVIKNRIKMRRRNKQNKESSVSKTNHTNSSNYSKSMNSNNNTTSNKDDIPLLNFSRSKSRSRRMNGKTKKPQIRIINSNNQPYTSL